MGYEIVKYSKGYNARTAFATKDGQLYYFSLEDLRWSPRVMYRTAESTKDYTGGYNRWDFEEKLADMGYKVFEKRQACDYNAM